MIRKGRQLGHSHQDLEEEEVSSTVVLKAILETVFETALEAVLEVVSEAALEAALEGILEETLEKISKGFCEKLLMAGTTDSEDLASGRANNSSHSFFTFVCGRTGLLEKVLLKAFWNDKPGFSIITKPTITDPALPKPCLL